MKIISSLIQRCNLFYALASIKELSNVKIDSSGMRPESFELVRNQRKSKVKMRPIEISVYPDVGAVLTDGRHRLAVAQESGDKSIDALIRYYDENGYVLKKDLISITLD